MDNHKHKGVYTSLGTLRMHPIKRKHTDKKVKMYHNLELANRAKKFKTVKRQVKEPLKMSKSYKKKLVINTVNFPVDKDGYIFADIEDVKQKGIRVKFVRKEGQKKRTVGLQIEA